MSKQTERDAFRSRWGFILACIGSAVGMGNIWRFPYLVSAWGGMTFLLPYFLFVLLIGSTGIIGEMALGRSTRSGPIGAWFYPLSKYDYCACALLALIAGALLGGIG